MLRLAAFVLTMLPSILVQAYVLDHPLSPSRPIRWDLSDSSPAHTNTFNRSSRAIRFFMSSDAWSTSNRVAELNALRASFGQWQAVSGTALRFEEGGVLPPAVQIDASGRTNLLYPGVNTDDNTNLICWTRSGKLVNGGLDHLGFNLGLTYTALINEDILVEADIVLNGEQYNWFTDITQMANPGQFVEATAVHEIGHLLGLEHSPLGGATLFWAGGDGVSVQTGLSPDDISGIRTLYGTSQGFSLWSTLRGRVLSSGRPLSGAIVVVEDSHGNALAGVLSSATGDYSVEALPPGPATVRTAPLDPDRAALFLAHAAEISPEFASQTVDTAFLPSAPTPIVLHAGATQTLNLAAQTEAATNPVPRIAYLREPSPLQIPFNYSSVPIALYPGQSNLFIGALSPDFPLAGGTIRITGDGIQTGTTTSRTDGSGLRARFTQVNVSTGATPGLRSLLIDWSDGSSSAANGFVEIFPLVRDDNFDGLDDLFQRAFFPVFTSAAAAPESDPDADGYTNEAEYLAGTDPTLASSRLRFLRVSSTGGGLDMEWDGGGTSRQFRVWINDRSPTETNAWRILTLLPGAQTSPTHFHDTTTPVSGGARFYRIEAIPTSP